MDEQSREHRREIKFTPIRLGVRERQTHRENLSSQRKQKTTKKRSQNKRTFY